MGKVRRSGAGYGGGLPWQLKEGSCIEHTHLKSKVGYQGAVTVFIIWHLRSAVQRLCAGAQQSESPQVVNPPLIHCLAANKQDVRDLSQVVAAACGDGSIALFDLGGVSRTPPKKGARLPRPGTSGGPARPLVDTPFMVMREEDGGHSGPVNHVYAFHVDPHLCCVTKISSAPADFIERSTNTL